MGDHGKMWGGGTDKEILGMTVPFLEAIHDVICSSSADCHQMRVPALISYTMI